MKKIMKFEIPVPEYNWVDVPTLYGTVLGEFESELHVNAIGELIAYMKRLPDIDFLINSNHQHVRSVWCRELIRSRLDFIDSADISHYGEKLSFFMQRFDKRTGINFHEYNYEPIVLSSGKKIKFQAFRALFNSEEEALKHIANIYVSSKQFNYEAF